VVFERVARLLSEQFGVEESTITMKTSFEEDLGADSLDIVELSMTLEEEFDFGEIEDGDLESLKTVGDVVELITSRESED
jgi:acyl carrier protein